MADILRGMRILRVKIRTGIDPEQYIYYCHPDDRHTLIGALKELGVKEGEFNLFNIHVSDLFNSGEIMVGDLYYSRTHPGASRHL